MVGSWGVISIPRQLAVVTSYIRTALGEQPDHLLLNFPVIQDTAKVDSARLYCPCLP